MSPCALRRPVAGHCSMYPGGCGRAADRLRGGARRLARALAGALLAGAAGAVQAAAAAPPPADVVLLDGRIATMDASLPQAQALAVRGGRIDYVGDDAGAAAFTGPKTHIVRLDGERVLPGLVDAHIHPLGIVDLDVCDLKSEPQSLAQITEFIQRCIRRYHVAPGQWLSVQQWNFANGNAPDAGHPNLRAALDRAARDRPIQLLGNDGHHGAFNSAALALARDDSGRAVGYHRATLQGAFAAERKLIGVDAAGEPDGSVNENARRRMGAPDGLVDLPAVLKEPQRIVQRLNGVGITAVQDALVEPAMFAVYDTLQRRGQLTVRANLAQFFEPESFRSAGGAIDFDAIVAAARSARDRYANNPLIRADVIKIFADGALEGNPLATPPTLPEAPVLKAYLQPRFALDDKGRARLLGYVDLDSAACQAVRRDPAATASTAAVAALQQTLGFHPDQCQVSSGVLQHEPAVFDEYVRRMHAAGFTIHIHAIGDRAVQAAVDAIEAARAVDGRSDRPDTIAHAQLVAPADVARIGRDRLFLAMTYAWAYTDPEYDAQVIPFIDRVADLSPASLHDPANYYERQAYPVRSLKDAGAILVAGSDAPVDERDPRPFVNMQFAVTRALPGLPPLNPAQALQLPEVVAAYTIDGARALGRQDEIGSLAVGKSADLVVLDRDIFAVPIEQVGATRVLQTWFQGTVVFAAKKR